MVPLTAVVSVRRLESAQSMVTAEPMAHRSGVEKDSCLRDSWMLPSMTVFVSAPRLERVRAVLKEERTVRHWGAEMDSC